MQRNHLLILLLCKIAAVSSPGQSLQESIAAPDKAVPVVNQTLAGTWLSELRRVGPTGPQAPIPSLVTFLPDGTSIASPSDGTQTAVHGMWLRVGGPEVSRYGVLFQLQRKPRAHDHYEVADQLPIECGRQDFDGHH